MRLLLMNNSLSLVNTREGGMRDSARNPLSHTYTHFSLSLTHTHFSLSHTYISRVFGK